MTTRDHPVSGAARGGRAADRVAVVEHEPEVAEMTRRYLERTGLSVHITDGPAEAIAVLRSRPAAAYVLDLSMPGLDVRLVRRALASGPETSAVLLIGARATRPRGLGAGPGQRRWLIRPFSPRALVEAVHEMLPPAPLREDGGRVARMVPGADVALTPGESAVLATLVQANGRVVTRDQLLAAIASGRGKRPGPRVVDVYITQLRAKLGHAAIRTIRSTGYAVSEHFSGESWQGKPEANSWGAAPGRSPDGASISREATFPIRGDG